MSLNILGKVTCMITREKDNRTELLLFRHPNAGIQFPAGTVELDESFREAVLREAFEETGVTAFSSCHYIGQQEVELPEDRRVVYHNTRIHSRPDRSCMETAELRRGLTVRYERSQGEFVQVSYIEEDVYPNPNYITYQVTGWVDANHLASRVTRQFFHMQVQCDVEEWERETDGHRVELFWAPLDRLPEIVYPQNKWVEYVIHELNYSF